MSKSTVKKRDLLDTVLRFLACWKNKNWIGMAEVTQRRWRMEHHPAHVRLKMMLDNLNVLETSIDPESKRAPEGFDETGAIYDLDVTVKLMPFGATAPVWKRLVFRSVLENEAGHAVKENGAWGVNPISILRGMSDGV